MTEHTNSKQVMQKHSPATTAPKDSISVLEDNLSHLISGGEQEGYVHVGKQQPSNTQSSPQGPIPIAPPMPIHRQSESRKSDEELVGWVKMDEQALAKDFESNLSGLGLELNAGAYNMSEVLNLPIFKQDDGTLVGGTGNQNLPPLQYILQAPTSPASKVHEETLTYLNQGQSYEIRLKKLRDLPINLPGCSKLVRSFVRVIFHDRRLQYTEHQQLESWKVSRPGDRLINIDMPMSDGIMQPRQPSNILNVVEFTWDSDKQASACIQVHCISTEFTAKKHGGERGVSFRIQIDTYDLDANGEMAEHVHSASCQIKVFKPKGADRRQKTDKEKMDKRSAQEKLKFKPSYDSTLLTECTPIPVGFIDDALSNVITDERKRQSFTESAVETDVDLTATVQSFNHMENDGPHSAQVSINGGYEHPIQPVNINQSDALLTCSTQNQTAQWLQQNRFASLIKTFANFNGFDMFSLTRDDSIQICGHVDGIRLYNALHAKKNQIRLTLFMTPVTAQENEGDIKIYRAFYLEHLTTAELLKQASMLFEQRNNGSRPLITRVLYQPAKSNIHVLVTNDLVATMKNEQTFKVAIIKNGADDGYQIILKQ